MYCNNCGKVINQDSKFCAFCGEKNSLLKSEKIKKSKKKASILSEFKEEFVWTCDYCGKEFDTKSESDKHEKICNKNPNNSKNLCSKCGVENFKEALFCIKCGNKLGKDTDTDEVDRNNIVNYYLDPIRKYVVFSGRSTRKEYWMFFFINLLIYFALGITEGLLGINNEGDESVLGTIYQLFIFLPTLAIGVRRMHDTNRSGWCLLIPIYNFIITLMEGTKGNNAYGSSPS